MSPCIVEGCEKPRNYAQGWCPMHYQRWVKHGSLDKPPKRQRAPKPRCSVGGCTEPGCRKGMCEKHYKAAWHQRNKARMLAAQRARRNADRAAYLAEQRAYYQANRDRILAQMAEQYAADPASKKAATRAWRQANPERRREFELRRRARKRQTQVVPVDYAAILAEHGMVCHICTEPIESRADLHFDHVVPLARGGSHTPDNIKPAHAVCNMQKGARVA